MFADRHPPRAVDAIPQPNAPGSEEIGVDMKKLLILGVGAQGSTVAKRMDEEPNVSELIVADYDEKAVSTCFNCLQSSFKDYKVITFLVNR